MTPSALIEKLLTIPVEPKIYFPVLRMPGKPKRDNSTRHEFYNLFNLNLLTEQLKHYDELGTGVRYLIDTAGKLLIAKEGKPGYSIPAHRQIADACIAAGNFYFDKSGTKITKINHESGDFQPDNPSLVYVLATILALKPDWFKDTIKIDVRSTPVEKPQVLGIDVKTLARALGGMFDKSRLSNPYTAEVEIREYKDPKTRLGRYLDHSAHSSVRLDFFGGAGSNEADADPAMSDEPSSPPTRAILFS